MSPNDAPGFYMAALRQCRDDFAAYCKSAPPAAIVPLVVNTMGWNQGLGLCLLKESVLLFKPTTLVQINHPIEANKNMPVLDTTWLQTQHGWPPASSSPLFSSNQQQHADADYTLITLRSSAPCKTQTFQLKSPQKRFSARDHRNIAVLAYFARLFDTSSSYFTPVHHMRPYCIRWSHIALHVAHARVHFDQLLRVFNASLVALCHVDAKHVSKRAYIYMSSIKLTKYRHISYKIQIVRRESDDLPGYLNEASVYGNQKTMLSCLGFGKFIKCSFFHRNVVYYNFWRWKGIVRGINVEAREIYLLTPEPLTALAKCNVLAKGMLNLPLEFFYEQDADTPCPYVSYADNWMQPTQRHHQQQQQPHYQQQYTGFDIAHKPAKQRKYLIHQYHNNRSANQPQPQQQQQNQLNQQQQYRHQNQTYQYQQ